MRLQPQLLLCCLALALCQPAAAESDLERQLKQLIEDHHRAAEAAMEPVNRRLQAGLEQLQRKALQAGDLTLAVRIKAELDHLQKAPVPTQKDLLAELEGTTWTWERGSVRETLSLQKDGIAKHDKFTARWEPTGPREIVLNMSGKAGEAARSVRLKFDDALKSYEGVDFGGNPLAGKRR